MRRLPVVLVAIAALPALAACGGGGASKSETLVTQGNADNVCYWDATVSDDGTKLLFQHDLNTGGAIWTEALGEDGLATGERQPVDEEAQGARPVFVSGGRVAYLDVADTLGSSIVVLSEDGSDKQRLAVTGPFDLTTSADRTWLYYTTLAGDTSTLHRIRPDGSGEETLFTDRIGIDGPAISRDGTRVAYARDTKNDIGEIVPELVISKLDGSGQTVVGPGGPPAWSPDGTRLAYIGPAGKADDGLPLEQIYLLPAAGGEPKAVTGSELVKFGAPVWLGNDRVAYLQESIGDDYCQLLAVDAPAGS